MSFQEKSALASIGSLTIVYVPYFLIALVWLSDPVAGNAYKPVMIVTAVPLIVLMAITHIVLAAADPSGANNMDERDRQITWRSERLGGLVLAGGVGVALLLIFVEARSFYVANALLLVWVIAEITDQGTKLVLYRKAI